MWCTHYSCAAIIWCSTGLYKSAFSTSLFRKLVFCLSALFVLTSSVSNSTQYCLNFYIIWIIIVYIVGVRCFCFYLLKAICKKKQIHIIKNLLQLLIKDMSPERFWVFKISPIKKKVDIHEKKECKGKAINKYFCFERI